MITKLDTDNRKEQDREACRLPGGPAGQLSAEGTSPAFSWRLDFAGLPASKSAYFWHLIGRNLSARRWWWEGGRLIGWQISQECSLVEQRSYITMVAPTSLVVKHSHMAFSVMPRFLRLKISPKLLHIRRIWTVTCQRLCDAITGNDEIYIRNW